MTGNILILSAGRRVSLVKAFQTEASALDRSISVYTADANPALSSACRISKSAFKLPKAFETNFGSELLKVSEENNIKLIIPTIDTEILPLSELRDDFDARGIYIMGPDKNFAAICRNKKLTHKFFKENGIETAKEQDRASLVFPVFAKPISGSSSINLYSIKDESHMPPFLISDENYLLLEYLDPKKYDEYTCDMYVNKKGLVTCIVPRLRIETRAGEVSKGKTEKSFLINHVREHLSEIPGSRGCVNMQFFVEKISRQVIGIEINPRFGGGYPLSYHAGANFPHWILMEYLYDDEINWYDRWEDELLMLRYDEEVIIHGYKGF